MALFYRCVLYCFGRSSLQFCHCSTTAVFAFRSGSRFMHQSAALRPPEVRCLKEEMVHGCTWTWMYNDDVHGYGRIQQLFRYCQLLILMCSIPDILEAFLEQKISEVFSATFDSFPVLQSLTPSEVRSRNSCWHSLILIHSRSPWRMGSIEGMHRSPTNTDV